MEKKQWGRLLAATAAVTAAGIAVKKGCEWKKGQDEERQKAVDEAVMKRQDYRDRTAHFIGGGLASLAGAAYLVRDCHFPGSQITVYEGMSILGGSNDGIGTAEQGYVCRGGRMLNEETYENFWELFSSIPSLENQGKSVTEEILEFDHQHPTCAKARLVDRDGKIQNVKGMGFTQAERMRILKLLRTNEEELDGVTIQEWFQDLPHFFTTNFWHMWQTTFAFQTWSSLFEFRRYMNRMIFEFSRIETLEGVTRSPYNQYDSVIRPIEVYLRKQGVIFKENCTVEDLDFAEGEELLVTALHLLDQGEEKVVKLKEDDLCFMINACMTDSATLGDLHHPAPQPLQKPISGELWAKIAKKKPGRLGDPEPFFGKEQESNWESFTVTCRGDRLLKRIEAFSGNVPGSGALLTFKDSGWKLSSVVAAQPHFPNQPEDVTIFWGYGLYTDQKGDYVKKAMKDCTGEEMLLEYLHQLHLPEQEIEELMETVVNVIPCYMPFVDAQFQPRKMSDRPPVVPEGSKNFALMSQFVEIPEDMVFTEEYSVRAARIAVYTLMGIKQRICPVTPYNRMPRILLKAVKKAYVR